MLVRLFSMLYLICIAGLSIYGLQALVMSLLFLIKRKSDTPVPPAPMEWPTVTVQLPIYNEKYVIKRLIDAVCKLDYPRDRLSIQVLDDSTDKTTCLAASVVQHYHSRGVDITLLHRKNRHGYKAGALAAALPQAKGELIAVFDADFVPPVDFLKRMIPYLCADAQLGVVQARWGHLNSDYNLLTRSQALLLDGYFIIEQTARSRTGLLFNFNGSGGIWRKECIVDSGGWQADTLAEDLDLSYRAQLKGWRIAYLPEVVIPGEIPPQIAAFKKQQYRWTRRGVQVLRKLFTRVSAAQRLSFHQRLMAYIHLSANLSSALILIMLLCSLPVVLDKGYGLPYLPVLSLAGLGGPLLFILSQATTYRDWLQRLVHLPILLWLRIGLAFNNTRAVIAGLGGKPGIFERTPKYKVESRQDGWKMNKYRLSVDVNIIVELHLGVYSAITLSFAVRDYPPLIPALITFTLGFFYTSLTGLLESASWSWVRHPQKNQSQYLSPPPAQQPPSIPPFRQPIY